MQFVFSLALQFAFFLLLEQQASAGLLAVLLLNAATVYPVLFAKVAINSSDEIVFSS